MNASIQTRTAHAACPVAAVITQTRREARSRDVPVRQELLRLMIHGVLHVLGHDHPEGHGREESEMWRLQERYLAEIE